MVGVSRTQVGNWEKNENVPRPDHVERLASIFGVDPSTLQVFSANVGGVGDRGGRPIPVLEWPDLRHLIGRKVVASALKKIAYLSVDKDLPEDCYAVTLADGSMEPTFYAGERVVISPSAIPRDGDHVVAFDPRTRSYVFRRYVAKRDGAFDLVAERADYETISSTPKNRIEIMGVMEEHRRRRR